MNIFKKLFNSKVATVLNTDVYRGLYQYIATNSPIWIDQKNEAYITEGFEKNADVFAIVNYITKRASTIPWKLYSQNANGELTEIKKHKLIDLLEKPNPTMGQSFFIQTVLTYKLILGNSYIYMPRIENGINKGTTQELWIMPASKVEIVSNGWQNPVDHYRFTGTTEPKFRPEDVIHLRYVGLINQTQHDFYGMSPLKPGVMPLTKSNYASSAEVRSFQTMTPPGILSRKPNGTNDKAAFSPEQGSFLKKWWRENVGYENQEIPITSAQLEFIKMGFSPVDLNILESSKLSFRQLCNLYQFPAQLLNDSDHSTYNNMREAKKAAYQDVIIPELYSLRDELNRQLVPAYGENLWLDLDVSGIDVLQDDLATKVAALKDAYWITSQDKQRATGFTEDPAMPKYYIPTSLIEMGAETEDELDDELKKLLKIGVNDYGK